jgi:hypothetical protein
MLITVNGKELCPLIEECVDYRFFTESVNGKEYKFVEGVFLQAQVKNRNGRLYPLDVMENEVNRYMREMVETNRAVGELGHPDGPTINPERVSHKIVGLTRDGNNYQGKAKILGTPFGKIVRTFLDEEVKFGVSSRGVGSLQRRGGVDYVQPDFILATAADIVMDPSAPDAFVRGIMENKEYIFANGMIQEAKMEKWKKEIKSASLNRLQEAKLTAYGEFLKELDNKFKF